MLYMKCMCEIHWLCIIDKYFKFFQKMILLIFTSLPPLPFFGSSNFSFVLFWRCVVSEKVPRQQLMILKSAE